MPLNNLARSQINAILNEQWPLEEKLLTEEVPAFQIEQQWRDDDVPSWAIYLVLIACSALLGAMCAFLAHL